MSIKCKKIITKRCDFIAEIVAGKDVLDIGCVDHDINNLDRSHWLHGKLVKTAKSVLGVDYESDQVAAMNAEGYNAVVADATQMKLHKTFDVIVAGEIIEHVLNPGKFLDCVRQHLTNTGELILTTPNANCLVYFLENLFIGREIDNPDHVALYSPVTIRLLLEKCGFEVTKTVFIAENTSYCHKNKFVRLLAHLKHGVQVVVGALQPSLCHHMLVIAKKK